MGIRPVIVYKLLYLYAVHLLDKNYNGFIVLPSELEMRSVHKYINRQTTLVWNSDDLKFIETEMTHGNEKIKIKQV